jgi:catechol 2,3-dioxygenase-like lactoylglutathione lyase family enzyme
MLGNRKIMAFVPTKNPRRSRAFYEGVLGLRFVSDDAFALVLDANGIMVRITKVSEMNPAPFTVLGWEVPHITDTVSGLMERGVKFEMYGITGQDDRGIWTAPSGARVAWFKDPDGNVLSLTQFP